MKTITLSIAAIIVLSGVAYFVVRDTNALPEAPSEERALTAAHVPTLLRGAVMHIPLGETETDVTIDSYASGDAIVLGGATDEGESTVTVFIPEFRDDFTQGAWGIVDGTSIYVPTYINFGGTGQFFMVALFTYDADTKTLIHKDLHFVNDRIAYDGMVQSEKDTITVMYRTHAEGEAMAEEPTLAAQRTLRNVQGKLEILE